MLMEKCSFNFLSGSLLCRADRSILDWISKVDPSSKVALLGDTIWLEEPKAGGHELDVRVVGCQDLSMLRLFTEVDPYWVCMPPPELTFKTGEQLFLPTYDNNKFTSWWYNRAVKFFKRTPDVDAEKGHELNGLLFLKLAWVLYDSLGCDNGKVEYLYQFLMKGSCNNEEMELVKKCVKLVERGMANFDGELVPGKLCERLGLHEFHSRLRKWTTGTLYVNLKKAHLVYVNDVCGGRICAMQSGPWGRTADNDRQSIIGYLPTGVYHLKGVKDVVWSPPKGDLSPCTSSLEQWSLHLDKIYLGMLEILQYFVWSSAFCNEDTSVDARRNCTINAMEGKLGSNAAYEELKATYQLYNLWDTIAGLTAWEVHCMLVGLAGSKCAIDLEMPACLPSLPPALGNNKEWRDNMRKPTAWHLGRHAGVVAHTAMSETRRGHVLACVESLGGSVCVSTTRIAGDPFFSSWVAYVADVNAKATHSIDESSQQVVIDEVRKELSRRCCGQDNPSSYLQVVWGPIVLLPGDTRARCLVVRSRFGEEPNESQLVLFTPRNSDLNAPNCKAPPLMTNTNHGYMQLDLAFSQSDKSIPCLGRPRVAPSASTHQIAYLSNPLCDLQLGQPQIDLNASELRNLGISTGAISPLFEKQLLRLLDERR